MYKAKITKEQFNGLKESVSNDAMRMFMNYVYYDSENERFVATDGKKLLFFPYFLENIGTTAEDVPKFWELLKTGKGKSTVYSLISVDNYEGTFPNYQRVFTPDDATREDQIAYGLGRDAAGKSGFLYLLTQKTGPVNFEYLKPLENVGMFVAHTFGEGKSMRIETKHFTYVVMPMHKDSIIEKAEKNVRYKV